MKKEAYATPQAVKVEFCYNEQVVASGNCLVGQQYNAQAGSCSEEPIYDSVTDMSKW